MKSKKLYDIKHGVVKKDKSLDKYEDMDLFPEQLKKANEKLKKLGLPKEKK